MSCVMREESHSQKLKHIIKAENPLKTDVKRQRPSIIHVKKLKQKSHHFPHTLLTFQNSSEQTNIYYYNIPSFI